MNGCVTWQPPEVLNGDKRTKSMDIFSMGCVYYYVLSCGAHPFTSSTADKQSTLRNILSGKTDLSGISNFPEATELVARMIHTNANLRPSTSEILSHCMFWDHEKKLRLLMDLSDKLEFLNHSHHLVKKLE